MVGLARRSITASAVALVAVMVAAPQARAEEGGAWPVRGRVLTTYLNDNTRPYAGGMHRGIDIAAEPGTEVVAARSGEVTFAGPLGSSGVVVAIRSDDGRHVASYLHLSAVSVARGEHVAMGARVGAAGTTGRRSNPAPHLHFGVRLAESDHDSVDPLSLLPPLEAAKTAPAPAPVAAPVRAHAEPAPVPVPMAVRRVRAARPQGAQVRPRGTLMPGPVIARSPTAAPAAQPAAVARHSPKPGRVPAGHLVRLRHPVPRSAGAAERPAAAERGRPLVLAGLGLVGVALFGGGVVRILARARALRYQSRPCSTDRRPVAPPAPSSACAGC